MCRYDPDTGPAPAEWHSLDEGQRILLVERYHRRARIDLPNLRVHAAIHVAVENQLAEGIPAVVDAFNRVRAEGLDRHDAIHAVGSVLAEHLWHLMREGPSPGDPNIRYEQALRDLSADRWRAG
jgi:hypothetical protein